MPDRRYQRLSAPARNPNKSEVLRGAGSYGRNDRLFVPPVAVVSAPPRCNFAGFCNYCGEQACNRAACIAWYLASWWAVCERCGGLGSDGYGTACLCLHGVVQVTSARQGAIQPQ